MKLQVVPRFPSSIVGASPITVSRSGGTFTVGLEGGAGQPRNAMELGMKGDGSNESTLCQKIISDTLALGPGSASIPAIYFPTPPFAYNINNVTIPGAISILGDGAANSIFQTTANAPMFTFDTTNVAFANSQVSGVGFRSDTTGSRVNECAISLKGANAFFNSRFFDLGFFGIYRPFNWSAYTFAGDFTARNRFFNITGQNNGGNNIHDFFYAPTGAQGSCVFSNMNIGATNTIFTMGDGTVQVGDLIVSACQFNGDNVNPVTAFLLRGGGTYGNTIRSVGNQLDAGITVAYDLDKIGESFFEDSLGGAVDIKITNPRSEGSLVIKRNRLINAILAGNVDDWAPTGHRLARRIAFTGNGAFNINGISALPEARVLELYNGSADTKTLVNGAGSSAGANRFAFAGGNVSLVSGGLAVLLYNESTLRWNLLSNT